MFDQLDLSPMMLLMLLLYGLLIAVILVLWTALDLGGRRRSRARNRQEATGTQHEPVRGTPERTQQDSSQQVSPTPTPVPETRAARRAADSDSVVSYSVKPRVQTDIQSETQSAETPATGSRRKQEPAPEVRPADREPVPVAEVDFPVGRDTRKPATDRPQTVTPVKPPPPRPSGTQAGTAPAKRRNEDAFERFLRSSGNDNDDY